MTSSSVPWMTNTEETTREIFSILGEEGERERERERERESERERERERMGGRGAM